MSWINCEIGRMQIRDQFLALKFNICVLFKPYPPELQCSQVKLSSFANFNSLKYWFCDLDTFPLFAIQFHVINGVQTKHVFGHVSSVDLNKTINDGGITVGFWITKVMTPI